MQRSELPVEQLDDDTAQANVCHKIILRIHRNIFTKQPGSKSNLPRSNGTGRAAASKVPSYGSGTAHDVCYIAAAAELCCTVRARSIYPAAGCETSSRAWLRCWRHQTRISNLQSWVPAIPNWRLFVALNQPIGAPQCARHMVTQQGPKACTDFVHAARLQSSSLQPDASALQSRPHDSQLLARSGLWCAPSPPGWPWEGSARRAN